MDRFAIWSEYSGILKEAFWDFRYYNKIPLIMDVIQNTMYITEEPPPTWKPLAIKRKATRINRKTHKGP